MRKNEILEKIETLFYKRIYNEVSLQNIADLLSIKKSSLYYYFKSKEVMYLEILDYSFQKYLKFLDSLIERWNNDNFQELLSEFLNFWDKTKNVFFKINQSGFDENKAILNFIQEKQEIIFEKVHEALCEKKWLSREKTYLFLLVITKIFDKKSIYGKCEIDKEKIANEIEDLFFKK